MYYSNLRNVVLEVSLGGGTGGIDGRGGGGGG